MDVVALTPLLHLVIESLATGCLSVVMCTTVQTALWQCDNRPYTDCSVTVWQSLPVFIIITYLKRKLQVKWCSLTCNAATIVVSWQTVGIPKNLVLRVVGTPFFFNSVHIYLHSVPLIMSPSMEASSHSKPVSAGTSVTAACCTTPCRCCTVRNGENVGTVNWRFRVGISPRSVARLRVLW
jgi:hypothetical protein